MELLKYIKEEIQNFEDLLLRIQLHDKISFFNSTRVFPDEKVVET